MAEAGLVPQIDRARLALQAFEGTADDDRSGPGERVMAARDLAGAVTELLAWLDRGQDQGS